MPPPHDYKATAKCKTPLWHLLTPLWQYQLTLFTSRYPYTSHASPFCDIILSLHPSRLHCSMPCACPTHVPSMWYPCEPHPHHMVLAYQLTLFTSRYPYTSHASPFCDVILSLHPSRLHCSISCALLKAQPFRLYASRTSSQLLQHLWIWRENKGTILLGMGIVSFSHHNISWIYILKICGKITSISNCC